jgi:hypothetical protein
MSTPQVQSNTTFSSSLQADFTSGNVIFNTCLSPPDKSTFKCALIFLLAFRVRLIAAR